MAAVSNVPELSSYAFNFEPVGLDGLNEAKRLNGLNHLNGLRCVAAKPPSHANYATFYR
jgi:hypothetical protein